MWHTRIKHVPLVARIYSVPPRDFERYALRLLLLRVPGATSFEDLRSYQGVTYNTFAEAAMGRNLLLNDHEFEHCMREAALLQMPAQLRQTFAHICIFCSPVNAFYMLQMFAADLSEDYRRSMSFEQAVNKVRI